jgi:hypothetical protein
VETCRSSSSLKTTLCCKGSASKRPMTAASEAFSRNWAGKLSLPSGTKGKYQRSFRGAGRADDSKLARRVRELERIYLSRNEPSGTWNRVVSGIGACDGSQFQGHQQSTEIFFEWLIHRHRCALATYQSGPKFPERGMLRIKFCPDGQITHLPVQPLRKKYSA